MNREKEFAAEVAIDWGDREHAVTLRERGSKRRERIRLRHDPKAVREWLAGLRRRFGGRPVALALEQSRGALMNLLMDCDFLVIYPINPRSLSSFREACRLSGAKDDPGDSDLLLDLLQTRRKDLRAWWPEAAETRKLRLLVRRRADLTRDETRLGNRLTATLKEYFPQLLNWFGKAKHPGVRAFLGRWPSLQAARRARRATLERFAAGLGMRKPPDLAAAVREAEALTDDPAVLAAHSLTAAQTARRLGLVKDLIREIDREIKKCFLGCADAAVFNSFPGAGKVCAPRLAAAFGSDRARFDAYGMRCYAGTAPVTVSSGKRRVVRMRRACPKFQRETFHTFAANSMRYSIWARAVYQMKRNSGCRHHAALRALADRWIPILAACWRAGVPYDEEFHVNRLQRRNSPVVDWMRKLKAA